MYPVALKNYFLSIMLALVSSGVSAEAVTGLVFAAIGRDAYTRASALWAGFRRAHLVEIESCLLRSFRPLM